MIIEQCEVSCDDEHQITVLLGVAPLRLSYDRLDQPEIKERFSALELDLDTRPRQAVEHRLLGGFGVGEGAA